MKRSNRIRKNNSFRKLVKDFHALSHQILQYANQGISRITFQHEVSKMIIDFSECDAVELWLKEHGKYFRCEARRQSKQSFSLKITPYVQNESDEIVPGPDDDPNLLYLCSEMIRCHVDPSQPGFTRNGSSRDRQF